MTMWVPFECGVTMTPGHFLTFNRSINDISFIKPCVSTRKLSYLYGDLRTSAYFFYGRNFVCFVLLLRKLKLEHAGHFQPFSLQAVTENESKRK